MLLNQNHREHPARHVPCEMEALLLCVGAAGMGLAGFVAAVPLAWSVGSCLFGSGLLLSLRRASTSSRWNRFGTMLLMWSVPLTLSVLGWIDPRVVNTGDSWRSGIWMLFAALGGFLFIVMRVTANRVGEPSLPVSLLTESSALALIGAFAVVGSMGQESVPARVATKFLQVWATVVAGEGALRLMMGLLAGRSPAQSLSSMFLVRQLLTGMTSVRSDDDQRFQDATAGSTSAKTRSVRVPILCGVMGTVLWVWLISGLVVVQTGHRAAYFRLGVLQPDMLSPGIHLTLPFPFARTMQFPVDKLNAMTIGFVSDPEKLSTQPMLWTRPHGESEFPFVVGNGTELVAINAVVHYRVSDTQDGLKSYVTTARNHHALLHSLSQHVLMTETRTMTLQGLLSADRATWGQQILQHLRNEVERHQLGLDVVQFDVLSIHPPIEVAESFLDIVAARVDAEKEVAEAQGAYLSERSRCEMMAATDAADASAAASVRLTAVMDETLHLESLASVDDRHSEVFRRRAFCNAIAEALANRTITFIDKELPPDLRLWLGSQWEIHPETSR